MYSLSYGEMEVFNSSVRNNNIIIIINDLQKKIKKLEDENTLLKIKLEEFNIKTKSI